VHTLHLQVGQINAHEVAAFERNPHLHDIVKVRVYDEAGKQAGLQTQPFGYYAPMVQRVVDAHSRRPRIPPEAQ